MIVYEYLTGTVAMVASDFIVVDVHGVGYRVAVADPRVYHEDPNRLIRIYIYQIVRNDTIILFGFANQTEKRLFVQLLGVSGIGPKSALMILAASVYEKLIAAIQNGDDVYLSKFPGIGKRTASRIIIELKDKVASPIHQSSSSKLASASAKGEQALTEALAALTALGYTTRQVERVKRQLIKLPKQSTNAYISTGLNLLSR